MRILLIEDDNDLGAAVRERIGAQGHVVDWMTLLADAEACMDTIGYDLVLLDMMLPDGRGIDFLRALRRRGGHVPVIILTAMDRISERIAGLDAGADDYLVKPFDLAELSARIGAVGRRYNGNPSPLTRIGAFDIDLARRAMTGPDGPVTLSATEWIVLETLLSGSGRPISRAMIEDRLYSFDQGVESNTVEVYVSRLRRKLGRDCIQTQRGIGYSIII
ncbi:response regulator transcription factor [Paracoccus laeviglucosivorans]|uniref:Two component transcriptional regulator, winged helix family n=1 Tax=Paracoccus laeviglucosivorans TaxID=1197861 RepID=A0A521F2B6_9RHOB|nr:response regulator transcription factor [Paracoccus laeviglucosivorans]SMO90324.1 two component transcriptional regulator, winged helix family [Paracoccus laeviglucosivorans]